MQQTTRTDLQTIRKALEQNTRLTSLSGASLAISGALAFFASGVTVNLGLASPMARVDMDALSLQRMALLWSSTLLVCAFLNFTGMLRRARSDGQPLSGRLARRIFFAMVPALLVGGALTLALTLHGRLDLIFGVWMLAYGASLMAAGTHSIASLKLLGVAMLVGGVLAVIPSWNVDFLMFVATFGAGHFLLGMWVGVRYGW